MKPKKPNSVRLPLIFLIVTLIYPHFTLTPFSPQYYLPSIYTISAGFHLISHSLHFSPGLVYLGPIFTVKISPLLFTLGPYLTLLYLSLSPIHPFIPPIYSEFTPNSPLFEVGCDDNVTNFETQYKNIVWNGWYKFDYYIMKPILTHNGPPLTATCPSFCHPITNCFTSHEAYTNHNDDDNEVSLWVINYESFFSFVGTICGFRPDRVRGIVTIT